MKKKKKAFFIISVVVTLFAASCSQPAAPKPRGYFRIDFPEKSYEKFESDCGFTFDIPVYATLKPSKVSTARKCWYDITFPGYNATIYFTYNPLKDDLDVHVEDIRKIAYKHIIKANDIIEDPFYFPDKNVSGIIYRITGNTASSMNFFLTDSSTGFVSGSLYFDVSPNQDSLAPAIDFFQQDMLHLVNSFEWE